MDAAQAAKQSEEAGRLPFIAVQEFWTDYEPQPDGSQKPFDMVRWAKKGTQNPATTEEKIARYMKHPDNLEWQVIRPYYERWKAGQTSDIEGTPLAAWPGATKELVKALTPANIRSVEDLSRMEDSAIQKISIPNLRRIQQQARAFLDAQKNTAGVSAENAKLKQVVESQAAQIEELRKAVESLMPEDSKKRAAKK